MSAFLGLSPFSDFVMTRKGVLYSFNLVRTYASSSSHAYATRSRSLGPAVRNLVEQYRIPQEQLFASGPKGFVLKGDVLKFIRDQNLKPVALSASLPQKQKTTSQIGTQKTTQKTTAEVKKLGPKNFRGQIKYFDFSVSDDAKNAASQSLKGKTEIAHAYLYANCTVDAALKLFSGKKSLEGVSLTDVVVRAVASCAQRFQNETENQKQVGNFDLAVEFYENNGELSSRILKKATSLGVKDVAKQLKETLSVQSADVAKVPFRVVSLIGSRLDQITEILSPGQNWVVSVGDALLRIDAKTKTPSKIVTLALSYDAAVFSEENAAKFLEEVKNCIERPVFMLVGKLPTDSSHSLNA